MSYESLDHHLELGIAAICDNDWETAREVLSQRLEQTAHLGRRRLNLYLLSVVAVSSGHTQVGEQFVEVAQATALELGEPRYLGIDDDPVRRELERHWWSFNHWHREQPVASALITEKVGNGLVDWAQVLDSALEGRAGELERKWSHCLEGTHPDRHILWNLVAIGYLESGDPRTYEEMRRDAPSPPSPLLVPESLGLLLTEAGMKSALADLEGGRWLTTDRLNPQAEGDLETASDDPAMAWEQEMETSFSLLSVGRAVDAARRLGPLSLQPNPPLLHAYTLNALALALFTCGEYGDAQEALRDGQAEALKVKAAEENPDLAERYATWLTSVGARGVAGQPFCDPFADSPANPGEETEQQASATFWEALESILDSLREHDMAEAKIMLRGLVGQVGSLEPTREFLLSLLFAGTAILEGDHMDAQEAIDDASRLLNNETFDSETLDRAKLILVKTGAHTLAEKMDLVALPTLDPWRDFPTDFPVQSFSGF